MLKNESKKSWPMAESLRVVLYPHHALFEKAEEVVEFDKDLKERCDRLAYVLQSMPNGIGLAANQVGWLQRVFIVFTNLNEKNAERVPKVYINPRIKEESGTDSAIEGCLSFPGINGTVSRSKKITVIAQDETGQEFSETMDGLQAKCFLHELDHLNGVNFVDHLSGKELSKAKIQMKRLKR